MGRKIPCKPAGTVGSLAEVDGAGSAMAAPVAARLTMAAQAPAMVPREIGLKIFDFTLWDCSTILGCVRVFKSMAAGFNQPLAKLGARSAREKVST